MEIHGDKIYYEILPDSDQPQKTIFTPNADMLKRVKVLDVGDMVVNKKKGDILTLYVNDMTRYGDYDKGFCIDRHVIFTNDIPQYLKVQVKNIQKDTMEVLSKGTVVESGSENIKKDDDIVFKHGQSHILPDNSEIISDSQIYFKF